MVEVSHLSKNYGSHPAIRDLTFSVADGQVYGLLGPNGAGKSTIMNILTGYLAPTGGEVKVAGFSLPEQAQQAKACVGYLPEQPPLYPEMTVQEYLDFAAGYAVSSLGYADKELNDALKEQIDKIFHTSNLYYNTACGKAAEDLKRITGMDRIFFTNSGGEAVEGTLKAARKYAYKKGTGRYEFIAMKESFHGRSFGAVSVTGHDAYREPFEPLVPGVSFAQYNDLDSVKALVTDKTCAIILEPLQGEGGINAATEEFMKGIRKLCDEEGILMICDEVMAGWGRTGKMFAFENFDVQPDIVTFAKGVTCGYVQLGGCVVSNDITAYFDDHVLSCGLTYSAHPLACAAGCACVDYYIDNNILDNVNKVGKVLGEKLEEEKANFKCVGDVRYIGLFSAIELVRSKETKEPLVPFGKDPEGIMKKIIGMLAERGFMTYSHENMFFICPPLIITEEQLVEEMKKVDEVLAIVDKEFL